MEHLSINDFEIKKINIEGKTLQLREIGPSDNLTTLLKWRNSKEFQEKCLSIDYGLTLDGLKSELRKAYQTDRLAHFIIYDKYNNEVGTAWIYNYDQKNQTAYTTIYIGPENRKDKYFGVKAFFLICDYLFNKLGCRKVYSEVHADNIASRVLFEKLDFPLEANFKNHTVLPDGQFADLLVFALYKEKFEELDVVKKILD